MELLSQRQVALQLGVSLSTIERLRKEKRLRWHKVRGQIRISSADVRGYLNSVVAPSRPAA
jgi:excisionase family DNA binding protein